MKETEEPTGWLWCGGFENLSREKQPWPRNVLMKGGAGLVTPQPGLCWNARRCQLQSWLCCAVPGLHPGLEDGLGAEKSRELLEAPPLSCIPGQAAGWDSWRGTCRAGLGWAAVLALAVNNEEIILVGALGIWPALNPPQQVTEQSVQKIPQGRSGALRNLNRAWGFSSLCCSWTVGLEGDVLFLVFHEKSNFQMSGMCRHDFQPCCPARDSPDGHTTPTKPGVEALGRMQEQNKTIL